MTIGGTIITTTLPTIVGMGVISKTTDTMFGKGKRARKGKTKPRRFKIYQGSRGGEYIIRKGRKIYI